MYQPVDVMAAQQQQQKVICITKSKKFQTGNIFLPLEKQHRPTAVLHISNQ
jgi:hypothetical protein